jgi:hypothetical protein
LGVQLDNARAQTYSQAPFLPHEHDESPETSPRADPVTTQAHADVSRGLVDTERRGDATQVFNRRGRPATKGTRRGDRRASSKETPCASPRC